MNKYEELIKKYEKAEKILSEKYYIEETKFFRYHDSLNLLNSVKYQISENNRKISERKKEISKYFGFNLLFTIICFISMLIIDLLLKIDFSNLWFAIVIDQLIYNTMFTNRLISVLTYGKFLKNIQKQTENCEEIMRKLEKELPKIKKQSNLYLLNSLQSELERVSIEKLKLQKAYSDAKENLLNSDIFEETLNTKFEETEGITRKRKKINN